MISACNISKSFKEIIFTILGTSSLSSVSSSLLLNDNDYSMDSEFKNSEYMTLLAPHNTSYWIHNKYNEYKQV